ncbi:hypothetical protein EYR38_003619 [Pleurotus pulmonarius]|nr:hypothetical protein EYR38_003619 [Pleurotus pulmonarius]
MLYLRGTFLQLLALISSITFVHGRLLLTSNDLLDKYDFIVVGGGTGGNVVASRLSEDPSVSVLVIEAGGSNDVLESQVPFLWPRLIGSTHDWNYTSAPQATLGDRSVALPRGHILGGSSSISWLQSTVTSAGSRASSATSYLGNGVIDRPNLDVLLEAQVTRLLLSNATNGVTFDTVEFVSGADTPQSVKATREIILSAGSIGTPNILLHSGVGDAGDLARVGIQPIHQLPSVGRNLTDHVIAALPWFANSTETFETIARNTSLQAMLLEEWKKNGTGFFSGSGIDHLGYVRLANNASIFDSVVDPAGPNTGHIELTIVNGNIFSEPTPDNFIFVEVMLTKSLSRGSLTLNSSNPLDNPIIDPAYLAHDFDRFALREAVRCGERFLTSPAWEGYVLDRVGNFATIDTQDDNQLDEFLRETVSPGLHFVGTASMSPKGASWGVTDPDLKVKGLTGIRVVDASVIPLIPAAHTQVPVYIFAERAAAFIKEDWKLV